MKKFKPLLLIAILLLFLSSAFLACDRNYKELAITEVKTDVVSCDFENQAVILSWVTNEETQGMVSYCTNENICVGSSTEPEFGTLHLFVCASVEGTAYYTLRVTSKTGETAEYNVTNPLTK